MIKKLQLINEKLIKLYVNDKVKIENLMLIQRILKEPNCFLKIDIETAWAILKDLEIPENKIKNVYLELLDE